MNAFAPAAAARALCRSRAARPNNGITRPFRRTPTTLPTTASAPTGASHEALASPRSSKKRAVPHGVTPTTRCASTRMPCRHNNTSPRTTSRVDTAATVISSPSRMVGYMLSPSARNRTTVPFERASSITAPKMSERRTRSQCISGRRRIAQVRYSRHTDTASRNLAVALLSQAGPPTMPPAIDVASFLSSAQADGILGLLHDRVSATGAAARLPPALVEGLRAGAHRQVALELAQRAELRRVVAAVRSMGLEVSGRLVAYQFHSQRIDEHGVRHLCDVHWKVANPQRFADAVRFDELAEAAVPLPLLGPDARGLGRMHALWLASVHRAAHHYDQDNLAWLYDVHLLMGALDAAGVARFVALAERTGVRRICLRALLLARARFGTEIPSSALAALEAAPEDEPSTMFLGPGVRKLDVLLDDVRVLSGWRPRLTLVKEHLFPDEAYMRRTYASGSSAPTLWLYARRIVTGAA